MAKTRVGINGFGRIGRNFFRAALQRDTDFELVAFNDLGDVATMAHLLAYDSLLGPFPGDVSVEGGSLKAAGKELQGLAERDPAQLPWADLGVDLVIESTGFFTDRQGDQKHLDAGAKKVIISAPATDTDLTVVLGVNDHAYDPTAHKIISNATCTTNCVAPLAKVPHDAITLAREVTVDEVNAAYETAAASRPLAGYLQYSTAPLVSTDINESPYSCIFDSPLTMAAGNTAKVFGWYDNQWGYSCRLVDLTNVVAKSL